MLQLNLPVIVILFSLFHVLFFQQIFDQIYSTCEYLAEGNGTGDQRLPMLNKVWRVGGTGRHATTQVLVSPCGTPLPPTLGCDRDAAVCILNTRNPQKSVLNAGRHFSYSKGENDQRILQSILGQPCDGTDNYTVIIEFDCQPSMGIAPTYFYKDNCELHLKMMSPTCTPTCTTREEGNLIDLRALQGLGSNPVQAPGKSFVVSLCAANSQCGTGAGVSACEVAGAGRTPLANINHQRITFDSESKHLAIKSYFGTNKRERKNFELEIRCNWEVPVIANLEYVNPPAQGRNFKFKAESALACVKLPMNCLIRDHNDDYIVYNLTSLNKENGGWAVRNLTGGRMFINICGQLRLPERSICTDQYSQACYKKGTRESLNLGSIASIAHRGRLKGSFIHGSVCATNSSLTYNTEIEFSCSRVEGGPVLQSIQDCTYNLKWETPTACSKQFKTTDNCVMTDITGIIDLNGIYSTSDREFSFTPSSSLRYNLCGVLNGTCNGKEANVCYVKNGQEFVVGFPSKNLTRDGIVLSTSFVGAKCDSGIMSMSRVTFSCNYLAPTSGAIRINMVQPDCLFEISVETPLACAGSKVSNCTILTNNSLFDLTPLTRNDSNYRIRDGNSDIFYYINICRSVINQGDILCPPFSGACLYNATEMEVESRYISMGLVGHRSSPRIENGELVIHYDSGKFCSEADSLKRSTVFRFQCSNHEVGPRLLKKDSCSHEFIWQTPSACAKPVLSVKTRSTNNSFVKPPKEHIVQNNQVKQEKETDSLKNVNNITPSTVDSKSSTSPIKKQLKQNNCVINNPQTKFNLNLKDIKPIQVTSSKGTNYKVMVNESSSVCVGYMCKNQQEIMWDAEDCPAVEFDYENSIVKLLYNTHQVCESGHYLLEVWLKCNSTVEAPRVVKELECSTKILYPLKDACLVLQKLETSTGIAIGSSVGLLIVALTAAGGVFVVKKRSPSICFQRCYQKLPEDKDSVRVYFKNTRM